MGGQEVFARNPLWQGVPAIWYANLRQFALAYLAVTGGDAGIHPPLSGSSIEFHADHYYY